MAERPSQLASSANLYDLQLKQRKLVSKDKRTHSLPTSGSSGRRAVGWDNEERAWVELVWTEPRSSNTFPRLCRCKLCFRLTGHQMLIHSLNKCMLRARFVLERRRPGRQACLQGACQPVEGQSDSQGYCNKAPPMWWLKTTGMGLSWSFSG